VLDAERAKVLQDTILAKKVPLLNAQLSTLADGGYAGDLMAVARAHIDDAIKTGRLTQKDAGQVYSSMIPAAISSAASFILNDAMQTAQILGIEQDTLIKAQQVLIAQQELDLKTTQVELETYRLLNIVPAELAQLQKQTDVLDAERAKVLQDTILAKKVPLLNAQLSAWNTAFNGGKVDNVPSIIDNTSIVDMYDSIETL
jgi:hypothetical protein